MRSLPPGILRPPGALATLGILALLAGCATTGEQDPISRQQRLRFQQTVHTAEQLLATGDFPRAAVRLREAQSDFYYAEHSPSAPERARTLAVKAQKDAESAVLEMSPRPGRGLALRAPSHHHK